ncbi:hypothetical protein D3C76_1324300 [compost metagenome]
MLTSSADQQTAAAPHIHERTITLNTVILHNRTLLPLTRVQLRMGPSHVATGEPLHAEYDINQERYPLISHESPLEEDQNTSPHECSLHGCLSSIQHWKGLTIPLIYPDVLPI